MRILVAEDSPTTRALVQRDIERLGHSCVTAEDGLAAWGLYREQGADVVVSDWMMPGLDGPELCRRIRAEPRNTYTSFVMLTVLHDKQHVLEAMRAGVDDFLVKPYTTADLEARLIVAERIQVLHRQVAERARLEGALLAAATVQHELNNQLAITIGYGEMLANLPELSARARTLAQESLAGAQAAALTVERLQRLTGLVEKAWGGNSAPTIDLTASPGAAVEPAESNLAEGTREERPRHAGGDQPGPARVEPSHRSPDARPKGRRDERYGVTGDNRHSFD